MKRRFLLYLLIGLSLLSVSCAKESDETAKNKVEKKKVIDPNGVMTFRLSQEPTYLNPILYTDVYSGVVVGMVFNGLFRVNESLEIEPDLVDTYSINETGTVYTFQLKKNVSWHDGHPFTAEDVKFTFDTILDPKTNTVRRSNFILDGTPVKFEVVDKYTVKAILPKPFAPFLSRVGMEVLPKHLLENEDINTSAFNQNPIGTGPFIFKEWKTGQYIRLVRNENYFSSKAKLKTIIHKIIPDANTAKVALEKGEIDTTGIQPKDVPDFDVHPQIDVFKYDDLSYSYMGFNLMKKPFSNPTFRQAIAHAVNRDSIIKGVLKGFGSPAYLPSSPVSWAYPEQAFKYDYNPEKSRQLFKQMGYEANTKTKLYEKDGKPVSFTLMTSKGSPTGEKTAQMIQQFLRQVGLTIDIQLMEWKSFLKVINDKADPKKFDAVMLGWSLGIDPDGYSIWHSSQYPDGFNFIGYKNKNVDDLLSKGRTEMNQERRKKVYHQLFNMIAKDVPYLFLTHSQSISAVNRRVQGLSSPGPAGLFNRIEDIYVVK